MATKHSVLISYSNIDQHLAEKVLQALRIKNINCWAAFEKIRPGESWPAIINEAINQCEIFLLILTKNSNGSRQVIRELTQADHLNKKLYCFQVENIVISREMQYFFSSIHRHEAFRSDFENSLAKMADDISLQLSEPGIIPEGPVIETPPVPDKFHHEAILWRAATLSNSKDKYEMYLRQYPEGIHREEAHRMLNLLKEHEPEVETTEIDEHFPVSPSRTKKIIVWAGVGLIIFLFAFLFKNSIWPEKKKSVFQPADSTNIPRDSIRGALKDTGTIAIVDEKKSGEKNETTELIKKVEVEASFPGGLNAWKNYLQTALVYPKEAINKQIKGTVVVQFIVDNGGIVSEVKAIGGPAELRNESVRLIKKSGKWLPGMLNGRKVKSLKKQAIAYTLKSESFTIEMAKAFTPNGDGKNDIFRIPLQNANFTLTKFSIYNRWGQLVFTTDDINKGWDGTYGNKLQNSDVYAYTITGINKSLGYIGLVYTKGDVTLIR